MKFKIKGEEEKEEVLEFWLSKNSHYGDINLMVKKPGGGPSHDVCLLSIQSDGTFTKPTCADIDGIKTNDRGQIVESTKY